MSRKATTTDNRPAAIPLVVNRHTYSALYMNQVAKHNWAMRQIMRVER